MSAHRFGDFAIAVVGNSETDLPKLNDTACSMLGFLHDRPMSGWDLAEAVEGTIGNFWHVTQSQIYRELRTLEEQGFVTGGDRGVRAKRLYTVTKEGEKVFSEWIAREPGDYTGRVPLLMTVWFGDHVPQESYELYLRVHKARHEKKRDFFQGLYEVLPDKSTPMARSLRFGMMFEQTFCDWFATLPLFGGVEPGAGQSDEPRPAKPEVFQDDTADLGRGAKLGDGDDS